MIKYIGHILFIAYFCLFIAAISVWSYRTFGLAGVSVGDYLEQEGKLPTKVEVAKTIVKEYKPVEKTPVKIIVVKEKIIVPKGKCTSNVRLDLVNHAYQISGGDMKFLGTIASESMFDVNSVGDGGKSFGLCQFHKGYQPDNYRIYKTLETDFAKLEFCHEKYSVWKKKGILHKRLYGYNVWQNGLKKLNISCNQ